MRTLTEPTNTSPPTASGAAARVFCGAKTPSALPSAGCSRHWPKPNPSTTGSVNVSRSPTRTGVAGVRYGRAVTLVRLVIASSRTMLRNRLAATIALAAAPGRASSVGCTSTPPSDSVSSPKLVSAKTSLTVRSSVRVTSMPSKRSRAASSAGRSNGVAAGRAAEPQTSTLDPGETWVWLLSSCTLPLI